MKKIILKTLLIAAAAFTVFSTFLGFDLTYPKFKTESGRVGGIIIKTIPASLFPISQTKISQTITNKKPSDNSISRVVLNHTAILQIPSLGIKAPIIFEPSTDENKIYKSLEKGVVHYSETPKPGKAGTSIILGHSSAYSWYKGDYGSIFSRLSKLKTGDVILIDADGQKLSYEVAKFLIFSPKTENDFELRELESTDDSSIVLMTCWPTGTNAKRIAVRADLI